MRLLEVDLIAFGAFTDSKLDFSSDEAGLHIVFGPNEAGKSTTLRAIQAALFGFPERSKDNFLHSEPKVGATLQSFDDARISFVRRKGRKNTLINPKTNTPLPEISLEPFLKGLNLDTFSRVYGINHIELGAGGEELRQLKGLVGESLFAASLGGVGLTKVLASLESEAAEIYGKNKRKVRIKAAQSEYKDTIKQKNESTIPFSRWQQLQTDLQERLERKDALVQELQELRAKQSRLERLRASLRPLAERRSLLAKIAEEGDVSVLPDNYSEQERNRVEGEIAQLEPRIASLKEKTEGDAGYQAQIEKLDVSDAILKSETEIQALQTELGAYQKAIHDRKTIIRPKRGSAILAAKNALRDLGLERDLTEVEGLRLATDRRVAIQNLGSDAKQILAAPNEIANRKRELEQILQQVEDDLKNLGQRRDLEKLQRVCVRARRDGDLEKELKEKKDAVARLERQVESQIATLSLWRGSLAELARLPVPMTETVNRFDEARTDCRHEQERLRSQIEEREQELSQVSIAIETLKNTDHVPTEQELGQARIDRDSLWQQIRQALVADAANIEPRSTDSQEQLAQEYELALQRSDEIADRLRREAERVEKLAQLHASQSALGRQLHALREQSQSCDQRFAKLKRDWLELWAPAGISQPLPPREMRDWLQLYAAIQREASHVAELQAACAELQTRIDGNCNAILNCSNELQVTSFSSNSLNDLMDATEELVAAESKQAQKREQLHAQSKQLRTEIDSLTLKQQQAETESADWQVKWKVAMQQIGCPEDASAAQANERLNQIASLFKHVDEVSDWDIRLAGIDRDELDFQQRVAKVAERVGLSPDEDPIPCVEHLRHELHACQTANARREHLAVSLEKANDELREAADKRKQLELRLAQLCKLAGVENSQSLPEIEQKSFTHTDRLQKIQALETQLLESGGGLEIADIINEAEGQDVDDLQAQATDVRQAIEKLEKDRDELSAEIREIENKTDSSDSQAKSVEADERALGILSRMHGDSARYLKLRVAIAALKQQIERHRAENEDPLLAKASDIFSRITKHEFVGLRNDFENDDAVIKAIRSDQSLLSVEQMSTGTRDQLYLALRLGDLQRRLTQQEPMPFFVDDILVHFDDHRSAATLEILSEFSRLTQVVMFTHHRRIVELVEDGLDRETFKVHQLTQRDVNEDAAVPQPSGPSA